MVSLKAEGQFPHDYWNKPCISSAHSRVTTKRLVQKTAGVQEMGIKIQCPTLSYLSGEKQRELWSSSEEDISRLESLLEISPASAKPEKSNSIKDQDACNKNNGSFSRCESYFYLEWQESQGLLV